MKILYITSVPLEYSSSANMRNIALISGIMQNGHEVSTLSYDVENDSAFLDKSILKLKLKERYFIKLGGLHSQFTTKKTDKKKSLKSLLKKYIYKMYISFSIYDSRKSIVNQLNQISINETFDLIISSSDPKSSHLLAERLIKKYPNIAKKWIQYWGDPFTNDINKSSKLPKWIIKREEKRIISKADKIVYVSPFTLEKQKDIFESLKEKMYFLPIPFVKEKNYSFTKNKIIKIGYFGDYYSRDRNILPLYNSIINEDYELIIYGNSDLELARKENMNINSRQSINIIEEEQANCDILVCICNKSGTQIPGKIYHYAATNKPILILLDGEYKTKLREYFSSFERYEICNNDIESIKMALSTVISNNKKYKPCNKLAAKEIANDFLK